MRGRLSTSERFRHKKGKALWRSPHPSRLTPSHLPPGEGYLQPHPAIAAQSRRAAKQGKQKVNNDHRRAAAGGERSTTTSLHPRRSGFRQASLPDGSPGSGASAPALGSRTEPSEAGQCGRRRGKGMQQGIPCWQGVPCGMDFDPTSVTFLRGKVTRPQAEQPPSPRPQAKHPPALG